MRTLFNVRRTDDEHVMLGAAVAGRRRGSPPASYDDVLFADVVAEQVDVMGRLVIHSGGL